MKRLLAAFAFMCSATLHAATFTITNVNDSGPGSLRWAIEQSNATPGADTINGTAPGGTIALASALPAITDRVSITFNFNSIIDGTHAGDADGFVIDAANVSISFLQVVNFSGDGLVIRGGSANVFVVTSTGNRNGIRIDSSNANIIGIKASSNRKNGIWITSTSSGNQIGKDEGICVSTCPFVVPTDEASGNAVGIRVDGASNRIDSVWVGVSPLHGTSLPNAGDGIIVNGTSNTVVNCLISNNGGFGVRLVHPARFEFNDGSCNSAGFLGGSLIEPPVITSARADPTVTTLSGEFHGAPDTAYRIDFLGIAPSCPYIQDLRVGWVNVTTDSSGLATWTASRVHFPLARIAAIASRDDVEVSRLSDAFPVFISGEHHADLSVRTTAPASASTGQIIEIVTVLTNNGPAAASSVRVAISLPSGTSLISIDAASSACFPVQIFQSCRFFALGAGESTTIIERLRVTATGGTLNRVTSVATEFDGITDPQFANNTSAVSIPVVFDASNIPAISPVVLFLLGVALALIAFVSLRLD